MEMIVAAGILCLIFSLFCIYMEGKFRFSSLLKKLTDWNSKALTKIKVTVARRKTAKRRKNDHRIRMIIP